MKIKYFLQYIVVSLGLTGWVSASAWAQQTLTYDILDLDDQGAYYTDCHILSSPNHQHVWLACDGIAQGAAQETDSLNIYFLFPVLADGKLGEKIKINLATQDWGLRLDDRLIGLSDDNQFVLLNLKTSEMVFLPSIFVHKGDRPADADAKRQAISNVDPIFKENKAALEILKTAAINQNTYLVLLKNTDSTKDFSTNTETDPEIDPQADQFWLLRLQNNAQQKWSVENITFTNQRQSPTDTDNEYEYDQSQQNLVVNNQGIALLYDSSLQPNNQSLYCFKADDQIIIPQMYQGNLDSLDLAALSNGNFIISSYKNLNTDPAAEHTYQAYRSTLTSDCKLVETAAWEVKPDNTVEAINVSPQGDIFLVYADYQNLEETEDDSVTPRTLYLAKFTQDNKLVWTRELVGKNDPWHSYLNLALPRHADDAVKYNMQINFSADGKQVLVMVYNSFQDNEAEKILAKDPKNLMPRIYHLPIK